MLESSRRLGQLLAKEAFLRKAVGAVGRGAFNFARKKPLTTATGVFGLASTTDAAKRGTSARHVDGPNPFKTQPTVSGEKQR